MQLLISPRSGLMSFLSLSFSSPFTYLKWNPSVACQNKRIFKIIHILYLQSEHWNIDAKGMKHKMKFTSSCKSKVPCRQALDVHMNHPPIPPHLPPYWDLSFRYIGPCHWAPEETDREVTWWDVSGTDKSKGVVAETNPGPMQGAYLYSFAVGSSDDLFMKHLCWTHSHSVGPNWFDTLIFIFPGRLMQIIYLSCLPSFHSNEIFLLQVVVSEWLKMHNRRRLCMGKRHCITWGYASVFVSSMTSLINFNVWCEQTNREPTVWKRIWCEMISMLGLAGYFYMSP